MLVLLSSENWRPRKHRMSSLRSEMYQEDFKAQLSGVSFHLHRNQDFHIANALLFSYCILYQMFIAEAHASENMWFLGFCRFFVTCCFDTHCPSQYQYLNTASLAAGGQEAHFVLPITCHLKRSQTAAGQAPDALTFPIWTRRCSNHVEWSPCCFLEGSFVSWSSAKHTEIHWSHFSWLKKGVKLSDSSIWRFVSWTILNFHSSMGWRVLPETTTWHVERGFASWKWRCILQHLSPFGALLLGGLEGLI